MVYFLLIVIALLLLIITATAFYIAGKKEGYKNAQRDITGYIQQGYITLKNKIYNVSEFKVK